MKIVVICLLILSYSAPSLSDEYFPSQIFSVDSLAHDLFTNFPQYLAQYKADSIIRYKGNLCREYDRYGRVFTLCIKRVIKDKNTIWEYISISGDGNHVKIVLKRSKSGIKASKDSDLFDFKLGKPSEYDYYELRIFDNFLIVRTKKYASGVVGTVEYPSENVIVKVRDAHFDSGSQPYRVRTLSLNCPNCDGLEDLTILSRKMTSEYYSFQFFYDAKQVTPDQFYINQGMFIQSPMQKGGSSIIELLKSTYGFPYI
ncbi:MAG: hypothetical protein HOE90_18365 [Bacteriovoracaceae bacterium]|jgi:hypothetical protein|nr:hypothetical protein [Bacteriovoracaceae bacterium]